MFKMVLESPSTRAKVYNKSSKSLIHRLVPYMSQLSRASATGDFTRLVGVRRPVRFGEGAVDGAALVKDEAAHGDGAQGEPEEALLRVDPDPTSKKTNRISHNNQMGSCRFLGA
jgi:hypothetical protein